MAERMAKEHVTEPADLLTVRIAGETPAQRLESYLAQVGDPYRVRVGQTRVRLRFPREERSLYECLRSYFLSLKGSDFCGSMRYDTLDDRGGVKGGPLTNGKSQKI